MTEENLEVNEATEATTETQEVQQQLSLGEEMKNLYQQAQEVNNDVVVNNDVADGDAEAVAEEAEEVEAPEEYALIPNEWSDDEKQKFQAALENPSTKEIGELLIERYNNLKKGYYKKAETTADLRKMAGDADEDTLKSMLSKSQELDEIFDPYKDGFDRVGMTPTQWLKDTMPKIVQITTDPVNGIKSLMQEFRISPEDLGISASVPRTESTDDLDLDDDGYVNPKVAKLEAEIKQIKEQNSQLVDKFQQTVDAPIMNEISSFQAAKDEQGNLKYPLFKEVHREMGDRLQQAAAKGISMTLEEAYFASPTVQLEQLKSQESKKNLDKDLEVNLREKRKEVKAAKKASLGVKGGNGSSQSPTAGMTVRDELKFLYNNAMANQ